MFPLEISPGMNGAVINCHSFMSRQGPPHRVQALHSRSSSQPSPLHFHPRRLGQSSQGERNHCIFKRLELILVVQLKKTSGKLRNEFPIAWVNISVFDFHQYLRNGRQIIQVWFCVLFSLSPHQTRCTRPGRTSPRTTSCSARLARP